MGSVKKSLLRLLVASLFALAAAQSHIQAQGGGTQAECHAYCHGMCVGICSAFGTTCAWWISDWSGPGSCGCNGACN